MSSDQLLEAGRSSGSGFRPDLVISSEVICARLWAHRTSVVLASFFVYLWSYLGWVAIRRAQPVPAWPLSLPILLVSSYCVFPCQGRFSEGRATCRGPGFFLASGPVKECPELRSALQCERAFWRLWWSCLVFLHVIAHHV